MFNQETWLAAAFGAAILGLAMAAQTVYFLGFMV